MEESVTYQAIVAKGVAKGRAEGLVRGEAKGLRKALLIHGQQRFGSPDQRAKTALKALNDPAQLEALVACLATAKSWEELLGLRPRRKRS